LNSPFTEDVRVTILKKLKELFCKSFSSITEAKIRKINDLTFLINKHKTARKKVRYLVSAVIYGMKKWKSLTKKERQSLEIKAVNFLKEARSKLKDYYEQLKR